MGGRLRKDVQDYASYDYEGDAENCGRINPLLEDQARNKYDQSGTETGPNGIGNSQRNRPNCNGKEKERETVARKDDERRHEASETLACLEG